MNSFYSKKELEEIGIKSFGENVLISRKASIYSADKISIGDNVRIDDFCILSGKIKLGSNIHISAFCALYGAKGIVMEDFSGVSPRSTIFSSSDDFSGDFLIGPILPDDFTNVSGGTVYISKYVQLGANSIVLPNVVISEGTVTGIFTLVNKSLPEWGIYVGIPARKLKDRSKNLLALADKYLNK